MDAGVVDRVELLDPNVEYARRRDMVAEAKLRTHDVVAVEDGRCRTHTLKVLPVHGAGDVLPRAKRRANDGSWNSPVWAGDADRGRNDVPLMIAERGIREGISLPLNSEYSLPSRAHV